MRGDKSLRMRMRSSRKRLLRMRATSIFGMTSYANMTSRTPVSQSIVVRKYKLVEREARTSHLWMVPNN